MPLTWETTPEQAIGQLADTRIESIHAAVLALALEIAPEIQAYMNASIPWHNGETDISPDEPNDMIAYVEDTGTQVLIHLSHDWMLRPEPSMDDELKYVPPALDLWGPEVMRQVRARLGIP